MREYERDLKLFITLKSIDFRNAAPPLPPHGVPVLKLQRPDYRPPVPPHRNIGVTANIAQPINTSEQVC